MKIPVRVCGVAPGVHSSELTPGLGETVTVDDILTGVVPTPTNRPGRWVPSVTFVLVSRTYILHQRTRNGRDCAVSRVSGGMLHQWTGNSGGWRSFDCQSFNSIAGGDSSITNITSCSLHHTWARHLSTLLDLLRASVDGMTRSPSHDEGSLPRTASSCLLWVRHQLLCTDLPALQPLQPFGYPCKPTGQHLHIIRLHIHSVQHAC